MLQFRANGLPVSIEELRSPAVKIAATGPLDITQAPETGILYVADGSLKLLRPVIGPSDAGN